MTELLGEDARDVLISRKLCAIGVALVMGLISSCLRETQVGCMYEEEEEVWEDLRLLEGRSGRTVGRKSGFCAGD